MEIEKLVNKAKQGDKEALVSLIMDRKQEYYGLAYVYMKNNEDALDAMEDMIVILYESLHQLKKEEAFYSWSKTILVNCCKKQLRRKKRLTDFNNIEAEATAGGLNLVEEQLTLESHLSGLSSSHQEIIKLRYYMDLDYNTIAELLKIPIGTVKSRISIGLRKLKESFGGEAIEK